jgi:sugar phosphate isomerase/epimerase
MNSDDLEGVFINKLDEFAPYLGLVYISDKSKKGETHLLPGEGILKLPTFLKKIKKAGYLRPFSIKLSLSKEELADVDKIEILLIKAREYIEKYYEDLN